MTICSRNTYYCFILSGFPCSSLTHLGSRTKVESVATLLHHRPRSCHQNSPGYREDDLPLCRSNPALQVISLSCDQVARDKGCRSRRRHGVEGSRVDTPPDNREHPDNSDEGTEVLVSSTAKGSPNSLKACCVIRHSKAYLQTFLEEALNLLGERQALPNQ